ncbi:MAG TPA: tetratricopeptide repeat protein [Pyrinomonadaceae bacterium]|nr:tetratricopeptide repeat protein [Pyrinomonadaceae bacterium]
MKRLTATLACLALLSAVACGGDRGGEAGRDAAGTSVNRAGAKDPGRLDAAIRDLERQVERNPADNDSREELSAAYVRRGDARREAQQLPAALEDYRQALRFNPDNEEAQRQSVELSPLVEGEASPGEFGEPAPLPISPNVIGEEPPPSPTPQKQ